MKDAARSICIWQVFRAAFPLFLLAGILCGCGEQPHPGWEEPHWTQGLTPPVYDSEVDAVCDPPIGWTPDPLKKTDDHTHQVWHSPSGVTAYGVIHFKMPLPVSCDMALPVFLKKMAKTEGDATLDSQQSDPNLPGIRFVAEGGLYQIRTNLIVDGWEGWAVYAGTLRNSPVKQDELDTAIRAREYTRVGQPDASGK